MNKQCRVCGCSFESNHHKKVTCSEECVKEFRKNYSLNWSHQNKDKVKEYNRSTHKKRAENGKMLEYQRSRRGSRDGYLDRFLERARSQNPGTDLTREYLDSIFKDCCAITGVPFKYEKGTGKFTRNPFIPSIDRIDSSLPYQKGNVHIVLLTVNLAKNDMSMDEFTQVWRSIATSWPALTRGVY